MVFNNSSARRRERRAKARRSPGLRLVEVDASGWLR